MLNFYKIKCDYLKFTGNERLDLIHRLSTNDVNSLPKYGVRKTVLTSDKGRFIDVLTLYNFADFAFASCSDENALNVIKHLDKYTIMDDFKAENMVDSHETILIYGIDAKKYLGEVFNFDFSKLKEESFKVFDDDGRDTILYCNDDGFGGIVFIYSAKDKEYFKMKLFDRKLTEKFAVAETQETEYETKRILFGIPEFGKEMNEQTNPLECGLEKYVSFTKGCYIGQEVISRLDTYDKVSKHLIGIKLEDRPTSEIEYNAKITLEGTECGYITSFIESEIHGNIGLGFVKTPFLDYTKKYRIKNKKNLYDCKIIKLPFAN